MRGARADGWQAGRGAGGVGACTARGAGRRAGAFARAVTAEGGAAPRLRQRRGVVHRAFPTPLFLPPPPARPRSHESGPPPHLRQRRGVVAKVGHRLVGGPAGVAAEGSAKHLHGETGAGRGRTSGGGGAGVPGKKGVDATRKLGGGGQSPGVERMPAGGPSCAAPQHTGGAPCRRRRARSRAGTGGSPGHPCQPPAPVESTLRQTAARLVEVGGRAVGGQRVIEVVGGVVLAALTAMGCGQGDRVGRTALSEQARFRVAGVCPAVRAAQHRPARQGPPRPTPHLGGVAQRLVRLLHPLELVLGGLPPRLVRRALQCTRTRAAAVRGGGVGSGAAAAAVAINASGRCSALRLPPSPQLPSPPPPAPACRGGAAARSAGTPP